MTVEAAELRPQLVFMSSAELEALKKPGGTRMRGNFKRVKRAVPYHDRFRQRDQHLSRPFTEIVPIRHPLPPEKKRILIDGALPIAQIIPIETFRSLRDLQRKLE